MEIWVTVIHSIPFCAIVMSLEIDFSFHVKYLFISTDTCTKYCRMHLIKKYMREDHEVLQCILVFPVNILVVSPVSYEFARVGFILKIAEEERERKGRRRGRGRGRWRGRGDFLDFTGNLISKVFYGLKLFLKKCNASLHYFVTNKIFLM